MAGPNAPAEVFIVTPRPDDLIRIYRQGETLPLYATAQAIANLGGGVFAFLADDTATIILTDDTGANSLLPQ